MPHSHPDYQFVTIRHLRRVEINDALLYDIMRLIAECMGNTSTHIEWGELDETLSSQFSPGPGSVTEWVYVDLLRYVSDKRFGEIVQALSHVV